MRLFFCVLFLASVCAVRAATCIKNTKTTQTNTTKKLHAALAHHDALQREVTALHGQMHRDRLARQDRAGAFCLCL